MTTRIIRNDHDKQDVARLIGVRKPPFTVSITKKRTPEQNNLQRKWVIEAAEQLGEETAEGYRGYCKLHLGVPILRNENDEFREKYDKVIKPMPYETKLILMQEPFDFPVTRLMTTKQKARYLDAVYQYFRGLGVQLTEPKR